MSANTAVIAEEGRRVGVEWSWVLVWNAVIFIAFFITMTMQLTQYDNMNRYNIKGLNVDYLPITLTTTPGSHCCDAAQHCTDASVSLRDQNEGRLGSPAG